MQEKYKSVGLNYDEIIEKYPNLQEYEVTVNAFLSDPFFNELQGYLDDEDYALAKDATKGLFILAQELRLMPLYVALMEIYEDIDEECYSDVQGHYKEMLNVYHKIKEVFYV